MNMKLSSRKILCILSCFAIGAILLCLPAVQNQLIVLGGKILGRPLNYPHSWIRRMNKASLYLISVPVFYFFFNIKAVFSSIKSDRGVQVLIYAMLFLIAFFTSTLYAAFPMRFQQALTDSAIFMYIGKMMHLGKVPYRDMFDHKGLALYFIEYLGTFVNGFNGIYALELVSMFITVVFTYKMATLATENRYIQLLSTFLSIYIFGRGLYGGGNCSEEYALPCIACSNYIFLKYLKTGKCKISGLFWTGVSFSIVLLIRVNMVAPWAFFVIYFLVTLIRDKAYATLRTMVIGFACGMLAVLVPATVYWIRTESLYAMWDSYILFNFKYISDKGGLGNIIAVMQMIIGFFSFPWMCLMANLLQKPKVRHFSINAIAFLVTLVFVSISGRDYIHYGMILLPFFSIPLGYVFEMLWKNIQEHTGEKMRCAVRVYLALVTLIPVLAFPLGVKYGNLNSIMRYLKDETPRDADVLVLGSSAYYNLVSDRYTNQRFFYQDPVVKLSPAFTKEFADDFRANPPDYVVLLDYRRGWIEDEAFTEVNAMLNSMYDKQVFQEGDIFIKR